MAWVICLTSASRRTMSGDGAPSGTRAGMAEWAFGSGAKGDHAHAEGCEVGAAGDLAFTGKPLVGQAWHVSCQLGAGQGPPCQCAQVRYHVHEVGDIPQPHGVVGAASGQGLAVWAE